MTRRLALVLGIASLIAGGRRSFGKPAFPRVQTKGPKVVLCVVDG